MNRTNRNQNTQSAEYTAKAEIESKAGSQRPGDELKSKANTHPLRLPNSARIVHILNSFFVSIYKIFGFLMLGFIVLLMASYLASAAFYHLSHRWVIPEILDPENAAVQREQVNYLNQKYQLGKLKVEQTEVERQLELVRLSSEGTSKLEESLTRALVNENIKRRKLAAEITKVLQGFTESTPQALKATDALKREESENLEAAQRENLLDRKEILGRKNFIGQLEMSNVERLKKMSEFNELVSVLQTDGSTRQEANRSLTQVQEDKQLFEVQMEKLQLESKIEPLIQTQESLQALIGAYEQTVELMGRSPFVRAKEGGLTIALAPYENLKRIKPGDAVYGCYLEFIFCTRVGLVKDYVAGESDGLHPVSGKNFRGQYVELELAQVQAQNSAESQKNWAKERSLVIGRPPLFF